VRFGDAAEPGAGKREDGPRDRLDRPHGSGSGAREPEGSDAQRRRPDPAAELEALALVGRAARAFAHDGGNLLATILGRARLALNLAEGASLPPEFEESLEEILRSGEAAAELLHRVLDLAQGRESPPLDLHLPAFLAERLAFLDRCSGSLVACRLACAPDTPRIRVSPRRLFQSLLNLVLNARDAMPRGGECRIRTARRLEGRTLYAALVVEDDGEGIPPKLRERVCEPFFTTKGEGRGTGLGLATVREFVEEAEGRLVIGETPAGGARFTLLFPALPPAKGSP